MVIAPWARKLLRLRLTARCASSMTFPLSASLTSTDNHAGGSYRVDLHITEALAASGECELLFCANHSTVAYHGRLAFLAGSGTVAPCADGRAAPPVCATLPASAAASTVHRMSAISAAAT